MARRSGPYGKMAAPAGPGSERPDALAPRLRYPPSPASAAPAIRRGFRDARRRPLGCGQRESDPSWPASPYVKMATDALSRALPAPPAPLIGPGGGPSRRAAVPSERRSSVGGRRGKMDAATLTYDTLRFAEFEDFPETSEPVWILGRKYSVFTEKDEIFSDVASRLWFTYRKNFPAIGGTGPTSDTGWGCMLRCGQMIFAQALLCRHLGRDWRWTQRKRQPDSYFHVLNAFIDRKDSYYSIHQIAQMGVGEGKSIGQWYGPNTVAQVLKKLAVFDTWSALAVHVAMDNTVVMEDIRRLCRSSLPCAGAAALPADSEGHCNGFPSRAEVANRPSPWRPLVLLIPLRLGLTDINEAYVETLKGCFMMPQSLGVIGGKPNSAHYFIGYVGEELIYLDPHTTQPVVEFTDSCSIPDESFHCQHPPSRMSIGELDPSIAVGFFCETEDDFGDWCQQVKKLSLLGGALPMFELVEQQPSHLACPDVLNLSLDSSDVERLERFFDSEDEDFEILSL
ncbi:LOW QUALITY PROTEIN: cysteine protease ATG4B [Glossophaga mutica]